MGLNAKYLMELALPKVEELYENRALLEVYRPIDASKWGLVATGEADVNSPGGLDGWGLYQRSRDTTFYEDDDFVISEDEAKLNQWVEEEEAEPVPEEPYGDGVRYVDFIMEELFNRRRVDYQEKYFQRISEIDEIIAKHVGKARRDKFWEFFEERVDRTSLFLHMTEPDEYVFYRNMDIEEELFEGLATLGEAYDELNFDFEKIPKTGREQYEKLNAGLQIFARRFWPDAATRYLKLMLFMYWVLPNMFRPVSHLRRFWLGMAKHPRDIDEVVNAPMGARTEWTGSKQVQAGDYYVLYCTKPMKGIQAIYRATKPSRCDPTGGWKGHWVELEKIAAADISLDVMREDERLKSWGPVRRTFQGTVVELIPPAIFNHLRSMFLAQGTAPEIIEEAPLTDYFAGGTFASEEDFEEKCIRPLLADMGFGESVYQQRVDFFVGCTKRPCRIDFLVRDERKDVISLFENKLSIKDYTRGANAYNQARSYAQQMRLRSFVVAAPEGLRFYGRHRSERHFPPPEKPLFETSWSEIEKPDVKKQLRDLLLKYAPKED